MEASRKRKATVVVYISSAAIIGALTWLTQLRPSHGVLAEDLIKLQKVDSIETEVRSTTDIHLKTRIDTLTIGMRYLVCRATLQDDGMDPKVCNSLLRDFDPGRLLKRGER